MGKRICIRIIRYIIIYDNFIYHKGIVFGNSDDPFQDISLNGKRLCKTPITDDIDID